MWQSSYFPGCFRTKIHLADILLLLLIIVYYDWLGCLAGSGVIP